MAGTILTWFERALFFSWGCNIGDCSFCYMSIQKKEAKETKRSMHSVWAETILAKALGWEIGFVTGGIGAYTADEIHELLKGICLIIGKKVWLSVGPVSKEHLSRFQVYIRGVVGSTETVNPILHKKVCPSKPLEPYERMFDQAQSLGLENAMTFIVGIGEARDDLILLESFIKKHNISKIHVYGLIPQKRTLLENARTISAAEQAWWISALRHSFPHLDIQCGIADDRVHWVADLLLAGADSISKFKAIKLFGKQEAFEIEKQAAIAGRRFIGSLTTLPEIDWRKEIDLLPRETRVLVESKLDKYIKKIKKNQTISRI